MKIGFLSSSTGWGGLERNLLRYARWMGEAGHEAVVFAVPGTRMAQGAAGHVEPFPRQPRYAAGPAARRLARRLRALAIEVLWVRDPRDLAFAGMAAERAGIPFVFQQGMQFSAAKRMPWHVRRFSRVTRWVAPTAGLAQQALDWTPLRADQITTIPLALDDSWFLTPRDGQARARWGWPEEVPLVGLFGRLDPLKGQTELLRALAVTPNLHAWFIGESTVNAGGDHGHALRELATSLGIADRVRFDPPSEDLLSAYDALDAYAMCSASETFGMVTLEALARGVFVVGTRSGGTPELLEGARGTALYAPGNPAELAGILGKVVAGERRWSRNLAQHTRKHATAAWNDLLLQLAP